MSIGGRAIGLLSWGRPRADLVAVLVVLVGALTAFMSSTAITAMFIPVVLTITGRTGFNRKRMLMAVPAPAEFGVREYFKFL